MPASEHESWRFDARSGSILGPNNQVVAVVEDRDREQVGRVFVRAFALLECVEGFVAGSVPGDYDAAARLAGECRGETPEQVWDRVRRRD